MDFLSDDESLAGLTQEPSQNIDSDGNLKLRNANDLIDCSGNVQSDFDDFAAIFLNEGEETANLHESTKSVTENPDFSSDLFPTPPETAASGNSAANDKSPSLLALQVIIFIATFFSYFL